MSVCRKKHFFPTIVGQCSSRLMDSLKSKERNFIKKGKNVPLLFDLERELVFFHFCLFPQWCIILIDVELSGYFIYLFSFLFSSIFLFMKKGLIIVHQAQIKYFRIISDYSPLKKKLDENGKTLRININ